MARNPPRHGFAVAALDVPGPPDGLWWRWIVAFVLAAAGPVLWLHHVDADGRAARVALLVALWLVAARVAPSDGRGFALRIGLAVALVAVVPGGAHREVALALGAAVVAHGALIDWSPTARWPRRQVAIASLALAPVALAAAMTARRLAPTPAAGVLELAGLLVLEAYHRAPRRMAAVDGGLQRALRTLAAGVATVLVALVALPLLWIPGWMQRLGRVVRRPSEPVSTWRVRDVDTAAERRLAGRPFGPTPPAERRRAHLVSASVAVVSVVLVGLVWRQASEHPGRERASAPAVFDDRADERFSDLPAYAGVAWADDLQVEQTRFARSLQPDPVTGTTSGTFEGRYTTVVDGVRRTAASTCTACPKVTAWLVGGSYAFGLGQRDEHTIASELVRLAASEGIDLEITNLAVPGWTLDQERRAVAARLQGSGPPDLLVELGGFNDSTATLVEGALGELRPSEPAMLRPDQVLRFGNGEGSIDEAGGARHLGSVAAARYRRVQAQLVAEARAGGIDGVEVFFQPDALATPSQFQSVRSVLRGLPPAAASELATVLDTVESRLPPDVTDLRQIYDAQPPVFVDWSHTNELGARHAAEVVFARIRPVLIRLGR